MNNTNDPKLIALKKEADSLGVKYHTLIGYKTLKTRVDEFVAAPKTVTPTQEPPMDAQPQTPTNVIPTPPPESIPETASQKLHRLRKEQTRLIRVVVHCNNDEKRDWEGETLKVGNDVVGSVTKFVPFDNEAGYHIPQIMLNYMEERVCQKWKNVRNAQGEIEKASFTVPEFNIIILPSLTKKDLEELADDQRARGAID